MEVVVVLVAQPMPQVVDCQVSALLLVMRVQVEVVLAVLLQQVVPVELVVVQPQVDWRVLDLRVDDLEQVLVRFVVLLQCSQLRFDTLVTR